jgi:electron transport complex protein RnfB
MTATEQTNDLVDRIDAILPQTQCTRCGFPACRPYASAIASGEAPINRCPPGATEVIDQLADLMNTEPLSLDPECGSVQPRLLARIEPEHCIGCTKCILACPVDAIIGGPKFMHTVLPSLCSGCELCVPPCPVDCIRIEPIDDQFAWTENDAAKARTRFLAREKRREQQDPVNDPALTENPDSVQEQRKQRMIEQAIARARARQGKQ